MDGNTLKALAWSFRLPRQEQGNRTFFTRVLRAPPAPAIRFDLQGMPPGDYQVAIYRTGFEANDAHTAYLRMGSPTVLSADQLRVLQEKTEDRPEVLSLHIDESGTGSLPLPMRQNDIVLVEIEPRAGKR